jgi:hypothetical protein
VQVAEFSNTYGWAGETEKDGKLVHVMLYHNSARNLFLTSDSKGETLTEPSGNAMILPIPAVPGSMTSANMMDGAAYKPIGRMLYDATPGFFEHVMKVLMSILASVASGPEPMGMSKGAVQVMDHYEIFGRGSYTVVLANNASIIPEALSKVPLKVRPKINKEIFDAYQKWYPGWTFALCCFEKQAGGEPIVWWYEPKDPSELFFPALDAHTGKPPILNTSVDVDHHLTVSSTNMLTLLASTPFSAVRKVLGAQPSDPPFVPKHVMGSEFSGKLPQGDFVFSTTDLRMGLYRPLRKLPPGASQDPLISFANYLSDPTLIAKIICGFLLAALILVCQKRFLGTLALFISIAALVAAFAFVKMPLAQEHYVAVAFVQAIIASTALLVPIILYAPKSNALPYIVGTVILLVIMFLLPGYSSTWAPIVWAALLFLATRRSVQKIPDAGKI